MKRRLFLLALCLVASGPASAMSCIEYMKLESGSDQRRVLEPIVHSFLAKGYKKIPDWAELANALRKKILEKGYTYQNIEQVAEEAAIDRGMWR